MAFPIKKTINTELFIDGTAALKKGETRISSMTNKRSQRGAVLWLEGNLYLAQNCCLDRKDVVNERSGDNLS